MKGEFSEFDLNIFFTAEGAEADAKFKYISTPLTTAINLCYYFDNDPKERIRFSDR
jgi:hypothetical protein